MSTSHLALISIRTYSNEDQKQLAEVLGALKNHNDVVLASSIFRVRVQNKVARHLHDLRNEGRFSGLCLVVKVQTSLEPKALLAKLQEIESQFQGEILHRTVSLNLLTYDDFSCMTPWLTLPHPEFHRRAEDIVPAAEIWGEYQHPVLGESLRNLSKNFDLQDWGEFYAQGKTVLDFC